MLVALIALAVTLPPLLWLMLPSGPGTADHAVFVRAPAQVVWDTFFMHVGRVDYRRGRRILNIETLATAPLTIRATVQHDIETAPHVATYAFPLYEPPHRYRLETLRSDGSPAGDGLVEAGELTEAEGGTWLRLTVTRTGGRGMPPLLRWLAKRRVDRNMADLAAWCEGRKLLPPRRPIRFFRYESLAYFALIMVLGLRAPWYMAAPVVAVALPLTLWRSWDIVRRF